MNQIFQKALVWATLFASFDLSRANDGGPGSCNSITINVNHWEGSVAVGEQEANLSWFNSSNWDFGSLFNLPRTDLNTYFGPQGGTINGIPRDTFTFPVSEAILDQPFSTPSLTMAVFDGRCQIRIIEGGDLNPFTSQIGVLPNGAIALGYQLPEELQPATIILDGGRLSGSWNFDEHSRVEIRKSYAQNQESWDGPLTELEVFPGTTFRPKAISMGGLVVNRGNIEMSGGLDSVSVVHFRGMANLKGGGTITLSNLSLGEIPLALTSFIVDDQLTNEDNLIQGSGIISGNFINKGVVRAERGLMQIIDYQSRDGGQIEIASTGALVVNSFPANTEADSDRSVGRLKIEPGGKLLPGSVLQDVSLTGAGDLIIGGSNALVGGEITFGGIVQNTGVIKFAGETSFPEIMAIRGLTLLTGGGELITTGEFTSIEAYSQRTGGIEGDDVLRNEDHTISGTGRILVPLENQSILSPGSPLGTLSIASLVQAQTGTLKIEIQGLQEGQFDRLSSQGELKIGGTLKVDALSGATFEAGNTIEIIRANSLVGEFSEFDLPLDLNGNPIFSVQQTEATVSLHTIDFTNVEPQSYTQWISTQGLDPVDQDPTDDPNKDGLPNLVAYALGVPANGPSDQKDLLETKTIDRGLSLTFKVPASVTNLRICTEVSEDLSQTQWSRGPSPYVIEQIDEILTYKVDISDSERQFLRLKFSPLF